MKKQKENDKEIIIIRTDKKGKATLKKVAKESRRSMSDYVRLLIEYADANKIKL